MKEGSADKVAKKIFHEQTECKFGTDGKRVCSPKSIVNKMADFAEAKGVSVKKDTPEQVVKKVKNLLNCNAESCILKRKDFVSFAKLHNFEQILNRFFKPEGPSKETGLLSNFNIDEVLDQLADKFTDRKFLHIPFQMRDFEQIGSELSRVDLAKEFASGTKTFGVVLNTDYSSGGGIHWFCLFGENYDDKIMLEYFNSSGNAPLPEVQAWLQKNKHYLEKKMKKPVVIHETTGRQLQYDNHSCGVYCLCYIWLRLEGNPPQWFNSENFNDRLMLKARKNLFRGGKEKRK